MLDAGNYHLRPRQKKQFFESDSDDDFQAGPSTRRIHGKSKQREDISKDEGTILLFYLFLTCATDSRILVIRIQNIFLVLTGRM